MFISFQVDTISLAFSAERIVLGFSAIQPETVLADNEVLRAQLVEEDGLALL